MLAPGVSSTIGIRATRPPSLLPARYFSYLGGLKTFTSVDEGSVVVGVRTSSTLSIDASTWGQLYIYIYILVANLCDAQENY
jgi:hypothetical protein